MKKLLILIFCVGILFAAGSWWTEKNTLYNQDTWVKPFFTTHVSSTGQIVIKKQRDLFVLPGPFGKLFMFAEAFFRIEGNVYNPEKPFTGNEQQIINQIHKERYTPTIPYTITGGHFAELYTRNFGIFFAAMLDPRIPTTLQDWTIRQRVTLQTLATHLELLRKAGREYTTFAPITSNTFVGANFNTEPSDSLYAIVYTLSAALDSNFIPQSLPTIHSASSYPLETQNAAKQLLQSYQPILSKAISQYLTYAIDAKSGLVKKNITLSSARDSIKRQSSFYDNVVAWATAHDATKLGIPNACPKMYMYDGHCDFAIWKKNIISAFWDDRDGLFIDDLSPSAMKNHTFTGEEFIVIPDNFFDLQNSEDSNKLYRMIKYVQKNNLDKPFPLLYAIKDQPEQYYFFVRYFATSYMGQSIWSHIGQEYIESLLVLSYDHPELLQNAKTALDSYKMNIEKYGGYPELYDKNGNIFMTLFYKAVLRNGWVINYEQAKMMYQYAK